MSNSYSPLKLKVWGEWACFTRPEMKAERVSYPVMTPSAARGILEAIFWKPEFHWRIQQIQILRPMKPLLSTGIRETIHTDGSEVPIYRHFSIMRNEVDRRASNTPISITDSRTQRHSLALRDVAYLIVANIQVRSGVNEDPAKYRDQFRRRVERGQCFHHPYLGCREFAADFAAATAEDERDRIRHSDPIDLGLMLFDIAHAEGVRPHTCNENCVPLFFPARLDDGIMTVPSTLYGRLTP